MKLFANLSAEEKLTHMNAARATMLSLAGGSHLLFSYAQLAHSLGRDELVRESLQHMLSLQDQLSSVLGDPLRAAVAEFPDHFRGKRALPLPPRLKLVQPPAPASTMPFTQRIKREVDRVLRRFRISKRPRRAA
jgi:hypothetical protein